MDVVRASSRGRVAGLAIDADVVAALERCHLGGLPAETRARLIEDAADVIVPGGTVLHAEGGSPSVHIVIRGLVRVVVSSSDGRQATIRYARRGDMLGPAGLFATRPSVVATIALHETRVVMLRPGIVRDLARTDVEVAAALLVELSNRVIEYHTELLGSAFAGLRQKVARHLLDIAAVDAVGEPLVARISQAGLADAVGTSREVVVRILRDLRAAGLVETGRDGIVIVAPERLHGETWPSTP